MKITKLGGNVTGINKPASNAPYSKPQGDTKIIKGAKKKPAKKSGMKKSSKKCC